MPKEWYDRHSINLMEDPDVRRLYLKIAADKKPYFMRLIYPALMHQYNTYIKNTTKSCLREFQLSVDDLRSKCEGELSDRQKDFLRYYDVRMPVGVHDCVMNSICRKFENEFDGYVARVSSSDSFDYTIMKSGCEYSQSQFNAIKRLYTEYNKRLRSYTIFSKYERVDELEWYLKLVDMREEFVQECAKVCPNRFTLCDIVLDICYQKSATKKFAWEMCGAEIICNLLAKNNGEISFPCHDPQGEIEFCGERFSVCKKKMEECNEYSYQ